MGHWTGAALAAIEEAASLGGSELERLRHAIHRDGAVSADEVRQLLDLHRSGRGAGLGADWDQLFIEAIVEHFALDHAAAGGWSEADLRPDWGRALRRTLDTMAFGRLADEPLSTRLAGSAVSADSAQVLVDALGADGLVLSPVEVKLLGRLFAHAVAYPLALRAFAWKALAATVAADRALTACDADLVRALVTGPASCDGIAVSRSEADMIVGITAIGAASRDPAWDKVVAEALAMHLLYAGGSPGTLDEAEQAWLAHASRQLPEDLAAQLTRQITALTEQPHPAGQAA